MKFGLSLLVWDNNTYQKYLCKNLKLCTKSFYFDSMLFIAIKYRNGKVENTFSKNTLFF